jgi:3-hydroxyisobutyrate dehydrogenase
LGGIIIEQTADNMTQRVALLGLGTMGMGMAGRLLGAGFPLAVFNRTAKKAEMLAAKGARVAASPREAASGADVIVSMVADDDASRSMWLGERGALAGAARGTVLVEASTLSTTWVAELSQAAAQKGCELLDTPVTGSKPQAASGELLFLAGGSAEALERARPVLSVMSRGIVHVGPSGSGALLKLINNFLCGIQAAALGEARALIAKGGLNQDKAFEVLTNGAPGSPLMKTLLSRLSTGVDAANFRLVLMTKDMAYSLKEAERRGLSVPMVSTAHALFTQAVKSGLGEKDFAAIAGPLETQR